LVFDLCSPLLNSPLDVAVRIGYDCFSSGQTGDGLIKTPFKFLIAAVVALVLGGAIGYFTVDPMLNLVTEWTGIQNGPWGTSLAIGSTSANPYLRAWIAKHGLLALDKSETIYLSAYDDDNGEPLAGDADYIIQGRPPDARWWSITAYGEDDFLIANDQNRYSFSTTDIKFEPDGTFKIYLSRTPKEGNWLPAGEAKSLSLSLRLYNPGPAYYDAKTLETVELPHIIKEGGR